MRRRSWRAAGECHFNYMVLLALGLEPRHCQSNTRCLQLAGTGKPTAGAVLLVDRETGKPQERALNAFLEKHRCQEACRQPGIEAHCCRHPSGQAFILVAYHGGPEELAERLGHSVEDPRIRALLKSHKILGLLNPKAGVADTRIGAIIRDVVEATRRCIDRARKACEAYTTPPPTNGAS